MKVVDADIVKEIFEWARFISEKEIAEELLRKPLTLLAEKLFNERRVPDYYRIGFDPTYRQKLLA